jgi:hypothetical protein
VIAKAPRALERKGARFGRSSFCGSDDVVGTAIGKSPVRFLGIDLNLLTPAERHDLAKALVRAAWSAALEKPEHPAARPPHRGRRGGDQGLGLMAADPAANARTQETPAAMAEEIARRVAELVDHRIREPFRLLDTKTVASMLAISEEWVREHAAELGAVRVGDGPKGALRFDAARVRAALEHRRLERSKDRDRSQDRDRRRPGRRRRSVGLVPTAVPADVKDW